MRLFKFFRPTNLTFQITPSFCLITINDDTENRFRRENFDEFAMELVRIAMNTAIDEVKIDIQSDTRDVSIWVYSEMENVLFHLIS